MMKRWKVGMIAGLLCTFGIMNTVYAEEGNGNKIHFINVHKGGSDAILLESNGHYAMVDTGEDYDFPDGSDSRYPWRDGIETSYKTVMTDRVFRHLKDLGVTKLDFILITHTHSDHIGNADELLNTYPVDRVYMKRYSDNRISTPSRLWDNLYGYDNVLNAASKRGVPVIQDITKENSHFKLGDMDIQLFNYENEVDDSGNLKKIWDDNSNSLISVISVNGKKIYLGGDLDNVHGAEDKFGYEIGKVDLMKFNHHKDTELSNKKRFINLLQPKIIVQTSDSLPSIKDEVDYDYINWLSSQNIERINAASTEFDATVFEITKNGLKNITNNYHKIPLFTPGWHQTSLGNWWYQPADSTGEYVVGWYEISNKYYYFDSNGLMIENQWKKWRNRWFYLHQSGEMATKWGKINEKWYFFNEYGQMETGWIPSNGAWYYLSKDGDMLSGWTWIDKAWYYLAESGEMKTGWLKENNQWYYLNADGSMKIGELKLDQNNYRFADDGHMLTGWQGKHYYKDSGEQVKNGWIKDNDKWYYFDSNGELLTNTITPEGYTVDEKGIWQINIPKKETEVKKQTKNEMKINIKNEIKNKTENVVSTTVEKNNY